MVIWRANWIKSDKFVNITCKIVKNNLKLLASSRQWKTLSVTWQTPLLYLIIKYHKQLSLIALCNQPTVPESVMYISETFFIYFFWLNGDSFKLTDTFIFFRVGESEGVISIPTVPIIIYSVMYWLLMCPQIHSQYTTEFE